MALSTQDPVSAEPDLSGIHPLTRGGASELWAHLTAPPSTALRTIQAALSAIRVSLSVCGSSPVKVKIKLMAAKPGGRGLVSPDIDFGRNNDTWFSGRPSAIKQDRGCGQAFA